jgi:hypothetical protein
MVRHSWQAPRLVFCPLGSQQCGSTHADRPGDDQYARERQHGGQYRTIRVVIAMDQVQDCTLQVQCVLLLAAFRSCTRYSREFHSTKVRSPGRKDTSPQLTIPYQKKLRPIPPLSRSRLPRMRKQKRPNSRLLGIAVVPASPLCQFVETIRQPLQSIPDLNRRGTFRH